jgi:sulfoquinovose isomerase
MTWLSSPAHARWLEQETDRLLDFARGSVVPDGGFGWLGDDGRVVAERGRPVWITCRMTHVFALGHLLGRPGCGPLVDHGVTALRGPFQDHANGGWYAELGPDGPARREKTAYEHAFVVLAGASATVAGRPGGRELLGDALEVFTSRFWDEDAGMVVEEWDEDFTTLDGYRGMNANMHWVEALLAAADATGDDGLRDKALRVTARATRSARGNGWRLPEHHDAAWQPLPDYNVDDPAHAFRPFGATIGHSFEWSRLALHLHGALGAEAPAWLLESAEAWFDTAVREGWAVDGADGFVYTIDWDGAPVVRQRMHWVAAEAIGAAAALWSATGEERFAAAYEQWWDHVATAFLDREQGSWRHELDPQLQPAAGTWSGKPDVYHALQATLIPRLPLAPSMTTTVRSL